MAHFVGDKGKSSIPTGKDPTPSPSPFSKNENGEGSSLAVLQFLAIVRGEWAVQAPKSLFRVERVTAEERYCLRCCGVRGHDVVEGFGLDTPMSTSATRPAKILMICRCCGEERYL